jgi:DNA replication ATP-dependent helicase Dna2
MISVGALVEKLLDSPACSVADAGAQLQDLLTGDDLNSRYVAQVAERALNNEYETVDEIVASLQGLIDRDPPIVEPKRQTSANRLVVPEIKVLQWTSSSIQALVTSGSLRDSEIEIQTTSPVLPYLWIHATMAAYNLVPVSQDRFTEGPDTFFVLEPMRQVNATSIARSLHCVKPQFDQMRRGKGDVTIHTLKGQLIHALFDKMLEGARDLESVYHEVLPSFLVPLASVTDDFFDEKAFRNEVLRHIGALKEFIRNNPHLLQNTQLELKRYSATLGIQGRIDAIFRQANKVDILELKTGKQIRPEDHVQLFVYRLLLSDSIRRWQRADGQEVEISSRLLCSTDGSYTPMRITTGFHEVLNARNKLIAIQHALGQIESSLPALYEGYDKRTCEACPSWTRSRCKAASDILGDRPDPPDTPELDYFRKFTRLIERERWNSDQDLADLLDDSRLAARVKNFRTICGARIVETDEPFTFAFERNTSDLERGDSVLLHSGSISSTASYHGYVKEIEARRIRLSIPLKNISPALFASQQWIIDKSPSDMTSEASHTALYDFLVSPMDDKKRAILSPSSSNYDEKPGLIDCRYDGKLNASQSKAVERSVNCDVYHLIWGPPGTGKTRVIPEIIQRINGTVLLGAFTNTAVDKMLLSLLDADPTTRFLRFGRSTECPELEARIRALGHDPTDYFTDDLARRLGSVSALKKALNEARILAATAHRASTAPFLRTRSFEMAIVDEAGQLTEPLTLGLILRARRFVLIGDDRQLPPVVRTRSLAHSMFERLKRSGNLTMLDVQYRMHPEIMDVSNRLFYEGRLRSGVLAADRRPPDDIPVVFIPVEADSGVEMRQDERKNEAEAALVSEVVHELIRHQRVHPETIGVVSPFRAQVVLLRQRLAGTGVSVDTIERFQGGERDIMILSFVRSRGTDFVFDERRLNVAITRARRKLVLVAHPDLFRNSKYAWISTFTETLKTAGTT